MPAGTLFGAIQAFQQSSDWAGRLREEQAKHHALRALGQMYGQPEAPQTPPVAGPTAGTGMSPDQAAGATQGAQSVAQTVGWPQQAGPGGPVAPPTASPVADPAAVLKDPQMLARLGAMAQGGPQAPQGPQLAQPGTPSMAQPSPAQPMKQPPVPGMSSTAQPDAAGMDDPITAAKQSLDSIGRSIKMANPNIDPMTLAMAVQAQVENIKGVSPLTKAAMGMQVSLMNFGLKQQMLQQRIQSEDQRWQIERQNANTREAKNQIDANHFARMEDLVQGRIDASIANNERTNATSRANTQDRDATQVTTTGMRDDTSRANNADTNARQDRGTTQRQGASDATTYRTTYGNYLRQHPKDVVGATRAARAAVSDVQRGTPRSDIPSGDPLAGGGAPAPRGGGGGPKPSAQDVAYFKQHKGDSAVVSAFKKHFGAAAAQAAMR